MRVMLLLAVMAGGLLFGQSTSMPRTFIVTSTQSVTSAAASVQVQVPPASNGKVVRLRSLYITCSVNCTYTQRIRATYSLAGGSTVTPVPLQDGVAKFATVRSGVTTATSSGSILIAIPLTAADKETVVLDAEIGANQAFAVHTDSITGTVTISITYEER